MISTTTMGTSTITAALTGTKTPRSIGLTTHRESVTLEGRSFSSDINGAKAQGLQPLKLGIEN
jgi:hypothetical protein